MGCCQSLVEYVMKVCVDSSDRRRGFYSDTELLSPCEKLRQHYHFKLFQSSFDGKVDKTHGFIDKTVVGGPTYSARIVAKIFRAHTYVDFAIS